MDQPKKKILIIEDDYSFRNMLYEKLTDEGYYVVMASGTEGAQDWAMRSDAIKVDMIISDQRMPDEKGVSFLSFLTELQKKEPEKLDQKSALFQEIRKRFTKYDDSEFYGLLRNIKAQPCIRVILSGYAADDEVRDGLASGVIHKFISKELDPDDILKMIRQLFEGRQV